ncbi:5-formyltetrahydrofolate cyclo-ligase [Idiomarina seosinensis]|uniref:5-formyltetrahydrofolate cyclo-ligase n=1 Tax=Idiomarina seosinensis TaxID=281739 RepID=A0A432ZC23_9GAMM|nr:5-formyltetrahydrofolate cyclo-ligase [Idiomarina seosinensis]RUO75495.1 5-formyltetrahydrofolate cyclo-ligase [Idiomarina seosinensis]
MTRDELRRKLLQTRTQLSEANRLAGAKAVAERVGNYIAARQPNDKVAAVFKSFRGELNTQPTITELWQQGVQTVLPVLHPFSPGHLLFLRYDANTPMVKNRYGISEPALSCQQLVPLAQIDWLFMPLVGFDNHGNRLGMGGGYYDRTLVQWRKGLLPKLRPIGLAFDQQYLEQIPVEPWDVPIQQVITPSRHWNFC